MRLPRLAAVLGTTALVAVSTLLTAAPAHAETAISNVTFYGEADFGQEDGKQQILSPNVTTPADTAALIAILDEFAVIEDEEELAATGTDPASGMLTATGLLAAGAIALIGVSVRRHSAA